MRTCRYLIILALGLASLTPSLAAPTAAPADTYFGRLKYSALRVRFSTQQLKNDLELHKRLPGDVAHMAAFTEDAYFEWARKFPKDRWLASTGYGIARLYEELPGSDARSEALKMLQFVRMHYPHTKDAQSSAADLRRGLPVRPLPAWAVTASPSPAPSPTGSATAVPPGSASPTGSAAPTHPPASRQALSM